MKEGLLERGLNGDYGSEILHFTNSVIFLSVLYLK